LQWRQLKRTYHTCLLALTMVSSTFAGVARADRAVIIIDDIGYNLMTGIAVAELPIPLTIAVIPFSPHADYLARLAKANGKDVIVHSPMASLDGRTLDPGGLDSSMTQAEFEAALNRQLAAVPFASGLNNHMGSLLTQQPLAMTWLMQQLKQKHFYFIDSRTTAETIAWQTAQHSQVTSWERDVFLDNDRDPNAIRTQLESLLPIARDQGLAVAIGHPYPETVIELTDQWQQLKNDGLQFVVPSMLIEDELLAHKINPNDAISE